MKYCFYYFFPLSGDSKTIKCLKVFSVSVTNSVFLLLTLLALAFSLCSLTVANSILCNANVLLILHLLPSVTSSTYQNAFKAV